MMMNHSPAPEATDSIDTYPAASDRATLSLASLLQSEIELNGPIPFDQWMSQCLYHPTLGYYTKGEQRVGREGDFYTSISVGSCFGMILAHRIIKYAEKQKELKELTIVETGANSGQLACDILDTLAKESPQLYSQLNYIICEPLASMRSVQEQTLSQHSSTLSHLEKISDIDTPLTLGILLSNELVDAFPVKLVTKSNGAWLENVVTFCNNRFEFDSVEIKSPELLEFTANLPEGHPEGYTTEFRPGVADFATDCAKSIQQGLVLTIDYGHIYSDFYASERTTGTLRTFHQHTAGENPLEHIGEQDITAHVDFTQLASAFIDQGLAPCYFNTQSRYLTEHASSWFQSIESAGMAPPSKLIRQFQTLTHPAMMGRQFHVLECEKNATPEINSVSKLGVKT